MNNIDIMAAGPLRTTEEAAEFLSISPRTVQRLARRGELRGALIGGRWRFSAEALRRFARVSDEQQA